MFPSARPGSQAMLEVLDELLPESFVVLDLGSGPGSISQRVLARFPAAQAIAEEIDPVMMAIGRGALGTIDGRLRWVQADLESPDWRAALGEETTRVDAAFAARGIETAEQWRDDLGREAAFAALLAERASRFDGKQRQAPPPGFDAHIAALRDAGFREVGTIWQVLADRSLFAVR